MSYLHCRSSSSLHLKSLETDQIEGIWLKIMPNKIFFVLGAVYRPLSDSNFFLHFVQTLEKAWFHFKYNNIMIVGDLNGDIADSKSYLGSKLQSLLIQFNLKILNTEPTRATISSSSLKDLIISNVPTF